MQTPLQMLIEILDREALDNTGFYTPGEFEVIASVKKHATELLEKEREMIIGVAHYAFADALRPVSKQCSSFEDFYTKTFTGKND